jgi:hypothetical protein
MGLTICPQAELVHSQVKGTDLAINASWGTTSDEVVLSRLRHQHPMRHDTRGTWRELERSGSGDVPETAVRLVAVPGPRPTPPETPLLTADPPNFSCPSVTSLPPCRNRFASILVLIIASRPCRKDSKHSVNTSIHSKFTHITVAFLSIVDKAFNYVARSRVKISSASNCVLAHNPTNPSTPDPHAPGRAVAHGNAVVTGDPYDPRLL